LEDVKREIALKPVDLERDLLLMERLGEELVIEVHGLHFQVRREHLLVSGVVAVVL